MNRGHLLQLRIVLTALTNELFSPFEGYEIGVSVSEPTQMNRVNK